MYSIKFIYVFRKGMFCCHILITKTKMHLISLNFNQVHFRFFFPKVGVSHILVCDFSIFNSIQTPFAKANNCHAFIYNKQLTSIRDRVLAAAIQWGSYENRSYLYSELSWKALVKTKYTLFITNILFLMFIVFENN